MVAAVVEKSSRLRGVILLARPWYWLPAMASAMAGFRHGLPAQSNGFRLILVLLIAGPGLSAYAEIINDICDRHTDALGSRKTLWGIPLAGGSGALPQHLVPKVVAYYAAGTSLALGLIASMFISRWIAGTFILGVILATAYSVQPVRLKTRGTWSLIVHAVGYGPVAFHLGALGPVSVPTIDTLSMSILIGAWIAIVGLTADLLDIDDDQIAGIRNFVVQLGRLGSTGVILTTATLILTASTFTSGRANLHPLFTVSIIGIFLIYTTYLWKFRRSNLPPKVHGLALVLEVLFPLYLLK